jgi:5,10-methylenetetrahydromethanopterin reductase
MSARSLEGKTAIITGAPLMQLNEIGFYALAGGPPSPTAIFQEVAAGETLGLGSTFLSERFNIKEAATFAGAVGAVSKTLGIATAATNHNTRHPIVTAAHATTMHRLTGGRYTLGLGRGIDSMFDAFGIARINTAQLEDFAGLLRRLFRGEVVKRHDGPSGKWPVLHLDASFDEDIPLGLVAFGPNSLALGGRCFDAVVLHTFFTDETTQRCVRLVREAAAAAGRDPAGVRIWSCYATVHDGLSEALRLKKTVGRLASYLQGYGDLLVNTNGWDPAVLLRFRQDPVVAGFRGAIDTKANTETLEHIGSLFPDEWLEPAATGSAAHCAERVLRQFDLGVDGVIMHGASPDELGPVVAAYRTIRPAARFDGLNPNPGRSNQSLEKAALRS